MPENAVLTPSPAYSWIAWSMAALVLDCLSRKGHTSWHVVIDHKEAASYYFATATAPGRWWDLTPGILPPSQATSHFLEELESHNVQYVALSDRDSAEYGLPTFGIGYIQQVYRWLTLNFRVIRTFGDYQRVNPRHWAVQIWERIPK